MDMNADFSGNLAFIGVSEENIRMAILFYTAFINETFEGEKNMPGSIYFSGVYCIRQNFNNVDGMIAAAPDNGYGVEALLEAAERHEIRLGLNGMDGSIAYTSACSRNNQKTEEMAAIVNYQHSCVTCAKVPDIPLNWAVHSTQKW
ncbi:MAG: hypothetical protein M1422_06710 [Candidatus Thermoplasmatota archaeon]|nr:hypothetical protein [Candidatus Thermoplasmatota archaeon]